MDTNKRLLRTKPVSRQPAAPSAQQPPVSVDGAPPFLQSSSAQTSRLSAIVSPEVISSLLSSLAGIATNEQQAQADVEAQNESSDEGSMLSAYERVPERYTNSENGGPVSDDTENSTEEPQGNHIHREENRPQSRQSSGMLSPRSKLSLRRSQNSIQSDKETMSISGTNIERLRSSSASSLASSRIMGRSSREALSEQVNGVSPSGRARLSDASTKSARPFSLLQLKTSQSPTGPDSPGSPSSGLGNHLIPSRRSSLRHGTSDRPKTRDSKRLSTSSRDLKDLNIDQDLIEEDYSAVKRIRELQEAKEKRQKEWRQEARKSEKQKRNTLPSPKMLQKTTSRTSSPSVVGILVEVPDTEKHENMLNGQAIPQRPGWGKSASDSGATPRRRISGLTTASTSNSSSARDSSAPDPPRHRRGISSGLKRSITTNSIFINPSEGTQAMINEEVDTFLASPRFTQRIKHPRTGRVIAFSEVGDPKGYPVICCVGMGLTRYVTAFYDDLAKSLRLRLITPDRPGIGESEPCPDGRGTPLSWADDVYVLCSALEISKFSLLAHSAGAIYALATALRLPTHVRGRIHLLAPWIPPSQIATLGSSKDSVPATDVPFGQKLLSILPASFLKVANASFISATSASISPRARAKRRSGIAASGELSARSLTPDLTPPVTAPARPEGVSCYQATTATLIETGVIASPPVSPPTTAATTAPAQPSFLPSMDPERRAQLYEEILTHSIWDLATTHANPAVDLLVCLERRAPIGFKYTDVTRGVVIHHGEEDTRVPPENVRWLAKTMMRAELRILPEEGHGLMASANVMASVLGEVEREWSEYSKVRGRANSGTSRE